MRISLKEEIFPDLESIPKKTALRKKNQKTKDQKTKRRPKEKKEKKEYQEDKGGVQKENAGTREKFQRS